MWRMNDYDDIGITFTDRYLPAEITIQKTERDDYIGSVAAPRHPTSPTAAIECEAAGRLPCGRQAGTDPI